jgi:hypothetical protein
MRVKVDGAVIGSARTSPGDNNIKFPWFPGRPVSGATITVTFETFSFAKAGLGIESYLMYTDVVN